MDKNVNSSITHDIQNLHLTKILSIIKEIICVCGGWGGRGGLPRYSSLGVVP